MCWDSSIVVKHLLHKYHCVMKFHRLGGERMSRWILIRLSWVISIFLWIGLAFLVQADAAVKVETPALEMKPEFYDIQPVPFGS
jgi:hypothetical protein